MRIKIPAAILLSLLAFSVHTLNADTIDEILIENQNVEIQDEEESFENIEEMIEPEIEELENTELEFEEEVEIDFGFKPTIQISEIYPNLNQGEEEWIELYNFGDEDINLSSYYFADNKECDEVTSPTFLHFEITPEKHLVITKEFNKVTLNDAGDTIRLCLKSEEDIIEIDIFVYKNSVKGKSLSREFSDDRYILEDENGEFLLPFLTNPTPGALNIIKKEPEEKIISIKAARRKDNKEKVVVMGYLTVLNNQLYEKTIYIQDDTAAIRIYLGNIDMPKLQKGTQVKVKGIVSESSKERKINAEEIFVLDGFKNFGSVQLSTSDFKSLEGILVSAEGEIVNNYATSFDIQTQFGILRISVLSITGIEIPEKSKGDYVKASGILAQYNDKFRMLPIDEADLEIQHKEVEVKPTVKKQSSPKASVKKQPAETKSDVLGADDYNETRQVFSAPKMFNSDNIFDEFKLQKSNQQDILRTLLVVSLVSFVYYIYLIKNDLLQFAKRFVIKEEAPIRDRYDQLL